MTTEPFPLFTPSLPFNRVTLELSLKPFGDTSAATRERVIKQIFRQWMPILHRAESVSLMLWIGDGSEILEYRGDLDDTFEWGKWLGSANKWRPGEPASLPTEAERKESDEQGIGLHGDEMDKEEKGLHRRPYLYRADAPDFSYRWLQELIADFKRIGAALVERKIEVGFTFDPGPEFAICPFKYQRHPELCTAGVLYGNSFVPCTARLRAEDKAYAGFPDGIPEDTGIGTFLGRQLTCMKTKLDFDFVWFSNGFGFGGETWGLRGELFDLEKFLPAKIQSQRTQILRFWREFRDECAVPIRTRGTNLTTGVDIASDGVPLREIYRATKNLDAPINSPWAALDGDFGLELAGWMSHVAELPNKEYGFRFYAHDPWWMNSPWFDRYERRPHDIFLPACVSRLDETGRVVPPAQLSILSIDNSHGQLPDTYAAEISGHLLRARELAPDGIAPLLWVYPFGEYHDAVFDEGNSEAQNSKNLSRVYAGDWLARGLINNGVPLNSVVSSDNFMSAFDAQPEKFRDTILVAPVPAALSQIMQILLQHARGGGKVLLYGAIEADSELLNLLHLETAPGWEGEGELELDAGAREFFGGETMPLKIFHPAIFSGGALELQPTKSAAWSTPSGNISDGNTSSENHLAVAIQNGARRALAVFASPPAWNGGAIGWLRGGISADPARTHRALPTALDKENFFVSESLSRAILARMNFQIRVQRETANSRPPILAVARARNAWTMATFNPDEATTEIRFPLGAPCPLGMRVEIKNGAAHFTPSAAWLAECRVFVEQHEDSVIQVQEMPSIMAGIRRRWIVRGLDNANVRFFPDSDAFQKVEFLCDAVFPYFKGDFRTPPKISSPSGEYFELENISGNLLISW